MTERIVLCKLRKGVENKLAWIPESIAKFGAPIKIITDKKEDAGWFVLRVYRDTARTRDIDQPPTTKILEESLVWNFKAA